MVICNTNIDQWANLPEPKFNVKKKTKKANFLPTPDSIIINSFQDGAMTSGVVSTLNTPKEKLLSSSLDKSKNTIGFSSVDPEGYLTRLDSLDSSNQEIQDLKKLRLMMRSLINTNPNQPQSWLAASRIEEKDFNIKAAKEILQEACIKCPDSEDIWIEAARLETHEKSKKILSKASTLLPKSIKIWIASADKETNPQLKINILKKALENNPESVRLWKEIVSISSESEAKKYLEKAVICAPHSLDLWLALAKLEPYKQACKTLNSARKQLPSEPIIWIAAAKLEETQGNLNNVNELIKRGIKTLSSNGVEIIRNDWIKEIISLEKGQSFVTAQCILKNFLHLGIDQEQKLQTWIQDLKFLKESECKQSFRYFYSLAVNYFPNNKTLWKSVIEIEKTLGDQDIIKNLLNDACIKCETSAKLWLQLMELTQADGIFELFNAAIAKRPDKAVIYLSAYSHLIKAYNYPDAEEVLKLGLKNCNCPKLVRKSISFYSFLSNTTLAKEIGLKGIQDFPNDPDLIIKVSEICDTAQSRDLLTSSCSLLPESGKLWISLSRLEETAKNDLKARYVLEKGRSISNDVLVYLHSIEFELRKNNLKAAELILNKGLQIFPSQGRLWSYAISMADPKVKKTKIAEALEKSSNCPYLLLSVAEVFQSDRKFEKSRTWYQKALNKGNWLGDIWIKYYSMEKLLKEDQKAEAILSKSLDVKIHKGKLWKAFKSFGPNAEIIKKASNSLGY
jgi:pre-mRNA-processing factor 6